MNTEKPIPIILLGSSRSGTSLLAALMNTHPEIICGSETDFWLMEPKTIQHVAQIIGDRVQRNRWNLDIQLLQNEFNQSKHLADAFHAFFRAFAKAHNKSGTYWAEKTVRHLYHVPYIKSLFLNCKFVHLIRNGYDNITSKLSGPGFRGDFEKSNTTWQKEVQLGLECETSCPERTIRIRYEDIVKEPNETMNSIFQFIGLPPIQVPTHVRNVITKDWAPDKLQYRDDYHRSWYENHYDRLLSEIDQSSVGRYKKDLPQEFFEILQNDTFFKELMLKIGYEL